MVAGNGWELALNIPYYFAVEKKKQTPRVIERGKVMAQKFKIPLFLDSLSQTKFDKEQFISILVIVRFFQK